MDFSILLGASVSSGWWPPTYKSKNPGSIIWAKSSSRTTLRWQDNDNDSFSYTLTVICSGDIENSTVALSPGARSEICSKPTSLIFAVGTEAF